ncbi:phage portal protein [Leptospira sp. 96542]|nr:phage portal protein [Leptospira sp. 96542]
MRETVSQAKTIKGALFQLNALDRLIGVVDPIRAKKRAVARAQLGAMEALAGRGGYNGGRRDKASLSSWNPDAGSPNADINPDLATLRSRARDQGRNAPVVVGAVNMACSNVVGTGLSLTPAPMASMLGLSPEALAVWVQNTRDRFNLWAASMDVDLARKVNFYGFQDLAFRSVLESGDTFVVTPRVARAGRGAQLALQLLEADRICNPNRSANTETLVEGVEVDAATGESVACHVARIHPGEVRAAGNTWQRIVYRGASTGRRNVLHLFRVLRPGQVRGVPWIAPILEPLKQLDRYTEAELNAAVTNALFSVFIKMDVDAFNELFDDKGQDNYVKQASKWSGALESGKAVNLLPGEEVDTATPGRPNAQFDPFVMSVLRQIGMALEIPFEVLVMHFQSSYSAARGAMLLAWKFFRARRDWLATNLCQPVYELWLTDEIAEGRISAPGFFANETVRAAWCQAVWTGDGPGSLDPAKEVTAAKGRVELGISTLDAESVAFDGVPWDTKHAQRAKEVAERRAAGLEPAAGAAASTPAAVPDPLADDEDEEGEGDQQDQLRRRAGVANAE